MIDFNQQYFWLLDFMTLIWILTINFLILRNFLSIFFILLYGLGLLRPIAPWIEYELNKDYIKTYLCVNKDTPMTQCGGRCYLKEQLESNHDKNSETGGLELNMKDYPLGWKLLWYFEFDGILSKVKEQYDHYTDHYSKLLQSDVFHPPSEPWVAPIGL